MCVAFEAYVLDTRESNTCETLDAMFYKGKIERRQKSIKYYRSIRRDALGSVINMININVQFEK